MTFARFIWKSLVAIKDGLVLVLLLLFFWAIYAALTVRPGGGMVREGALYLPLEGPVVEERTRINATQLLISRNGPRKEYQERDLVRAIEGAATDQRIKAVVIDLEKFGGGRQVHLARIGEAMDKVRAAKKPVLVRSNYYTDSSMLLAAHASEVWVDPIGGAVISGPGGTNLYYKSLLDRLKVKAHVFRVGTFKSAVEPYIRDDASPASKEALGAVYAAVWEAWQADVHKARPQADIALVTGDPVKWLAAAGNDSALAAKQAGLVDQIGDKAAFGARVARIVGAESGATAGTFRSTQLGAYLADLGEPHPGKGIAVVTIANEIVDGDAGPGIAGGDRIAKLLDDAALKDYPALVVRVDSPGGSVLASERIRAAIERWKASGKPVIVSMANLAASGGYWVSTPASRIFAEPATITGSIGIFGIVPSFEDTLANWGVHADGVRTTPLSGQPDLFGGLTPQVEQIAQAEIEQNYARFLGLVAKSRNKTPAEIDKIAQGRIWDGGTARQLGLVDQLGDLDDALVFAAGAAKLAPGAWHPVFLGNKPDTLTSVIEQAMGKNVDSDSGSDDGSAGDIIALASAHQRGLAAQLDHDLSLLLSGQGAQAYCLECAGVATTNGAVPSAKGWLGHILARLLG
ncbi:signal peptide peptidase SppA [Novosphingobium lentum]|uniref:signal peptide peptidase SppA n=1 Tax=Novosphingobium lentum TaxID=145287 RepID=UPI00082A0F6E|nr:signal peptide peptidase SppA [Novosphingobium lentum]